MSDNEFDYEPEPYVPFQPDRVTLSYPSLPDVLRVITKEPVSKLIKDREFNNIVLAFNALAPKTMAALPSSVIAKIRDKENPAKGVDVKSRQIVIEHFRTAHLRDVMTGSKPPSQPEQYAPPAAKRVLPDSRRRAEGRRPR